MMLLLNTPNTKRKQGREQEERGEADEDEEKEEENIEMFYAGRDGTLGRSAIFINVTRVRGCLGDKLIRPDIILRKPLHSGFPAMQSMIES